MDYRLKIKPAIPPGHRHKIEDALKKQGYSVHGGGTDTDGSECDVSFSRKGRIRKVQLDRFGE